MRGIIIFKGKYGATEQYASWLSKVLTLPSKPTHECSDADITKADFIILGSSVYIGMLSIKEWIKTHQEQLSGKTIFLFVVSGTPAHEKEKLHSYVAASVAASIAANCRIYFLPGRLTFKKLSWADKMMLRIGYWLAPKKQKEKMHIGDYDAVKKENLEPLIDDVRKEFSTSRKLMSYS